MSLERCPPGSSRANPARQRVLASYLEPIERWRLEQSGRAGIRSTEIEIGSGRLALDASEVELIVQSPSSEVCDPVESFALLAKSADDLMRLMTATSSTELYAAQAELMLNSALGASLLAEVQARVDELVARGDVAQAKAMTGLRHRLRHGLSEVDRVIADSERERVESLSASLGGQPGADAEQAPVERPTFGADAKAGRKVEKKPRARGRARAVVRAGLSATSLLAIALLAAIVLWLGPTVFPRALDSEPRALTRKDLAEIAVVQIVQARPPSLFLQLDGETWEALDEPERRAVVQKVARKLTRHGYRGALLATTRGKPVAHWLADRGGALLESVEPAPASSAQP